MGRLCVRLPLGAVWPECRPDCHSPLGPAYPFLRSSWVLSCQEVPLSTFSTWELLSRFCSLPCDTLWLN